MYNLVYSLQWEHRPGQHGEPVDEVLREAEELVLVGPGGEDGAEDQVELHDGQVQVHRLELLRQAGVLHLEVPAQDREVVLEIS